MLLQQLTVPQLVKKLHAFYGTRRLSTTSVTHHWSLPWATWIHFVSSQPIPFRYILILSTHPHLGHSQSLFPSGFCTKILCAFPFLPQHTTCTQHLTLLNLPITTVFDKYYKSQNLSLCSFFQPPVSLSTLGPSIFLSTLLSNIQSLCSILNVTGQFWHPHKTSKIIILFTSVLTFLDGKQEDKRLWTEC